MREMPHNLNSTSANTANAGVNNQAYPPAQSYHNNNNHYHYIGDGINPEKEPVEFDTSHLRGAPAEVETLVHNIKDVAQQFLYHWKTFPIILPPSISICSDNDDTLVRKKYHLRDLFVAPSFDELDAVAVDNKGEPRRLTNKQLESIRERGEFEVDSINFAGQVHRWRLSWLLQRGRDRRRETLLTDLALATRFIVVTAKSRIVSHCFSVSQSCKSLLTGLLRLLDILVGVPSLQAQNLEGKIREERCRYLVAELVCRPEYDDSLELLCGFVRKQLRRAAMEKFEVERESSQLLPVPVPFVFSTPNGTPVDLRLFNRDIIKKALPILMTILERETRGWFLHFRERLISELRSKKMPDEEIEQQVNEAVMHEYLQRVYSSILTNNDIKLLGDGIGQLLVQQAQTVVLMHRAVETIQRKLHETKLTLKKKMITEHPILSRIVPWMRNKLCEIEANFTDECEWSAHEEALLLCKQQNLQQTIYFLNRDLKFMREREPVLLKELRKVKTPTRNYQWPIQIWLPRNWIVRRSFQGQSEIIPTILSNTPTTITTPRADPSQPVYLVEREILHTTTTRWPMWRWINYISRTWCWTWNAMFLFGVAVPWCSRVSLRALLLVEPFTPDLELSQLNGTLFPRKSSQTPTLSSRLITLWRHISKSRTHFETEPDTGFIGKGMTRHINRLWNYGVKGLLGTICILFLFPIICILTSITSLIIAISAFIWMPIVTLIFYCFMGLFIDFDSPEKGRNRYFIIAEALIWNIFIQGLIQPILSLIVAIIICPLISFVILTFAVVRYWIRVIWDTAMFHFVIKKRGRIPACDSFVVKRISGPGLASDYYYKIRPEQALAAFEAKIELDELLAFQAETERLITQPQRDFTQFIEACFSPFATSLSKTREPYKILEKEARDLVSVLHEKLDKRRKDLQIGLGISIKSKIKLTTYDLKIVIQQASIMLERLYPTHIFSRLNTSEDDFWDNKGLGIGDWAGLAGLMFADIFSLDFLQPLDDTDTTFKLEPHNAIDLKKYTDMLNNTELMTGINGPDLLGAIYTPRGNIQIHSPYLEISAFNPRFRSSSYNNNYNNNSHSNNSGRKTTDKHRSINHFSLLLNKEKTNRDHHHHHHNKKRTIGGNSSCDNNNNNDNGIFDNTNDTRWQPWKRKMRAYSAEKLLIPLPIPHPAHIAINIHNRDSEDPISLDSDICQNILKAIEESPGEMATGSISRYRGGDSSLDSVVSQSSVSIQTGLDKEDNDTEDTINHHDEDDDDDNDEDDDDDNHKRVGGGETYHWTLSNWAGGMARRRNNSGSIKVDLASPEDVTLETDTTRVMFTSYGTTV
ncbi:uncharacterized protein LOC122852871 isoform X2 [Aphidius gifuensis]|uniref:uncharacterized protein LOC122852871 isoform X2 n=1 Tax=Aphidius gifuensis TaxID=684658 RepID=UPI001CDCF8EC|nr:uncharacterized protein LOC122852871 isoform X2 [Aphidius gifuensis]